MIYKVSYVVVGEMHPGEIVNQDEPPEIGDRIELGTDLFEVLEVVDLAPPRGEFAYLHATCTPV